MAIVNLYGTAGQGINWPASAIPQISNISDVYATSSQLGATADIAVDKTRTVSVSFSRSFGIENGLATSGSVTGLSLNTNDGYLATYVDNINSPVEEIIAIGDDIDMARQFEMNLLSGDDILKGSIGGGSVKARMMAGNDYVEIFGGNDNFVNGNIGSDMIVLYGGFGRYLGGSENDSIEVFSAEPGTQVNGNRGVDLITGNVDAVTYRGGSESDKLTVSAGTVWGDLGADVFQAVAGNGIAAVQDYTPGVDFIEGVAGGTFTQSSQGLFYGLGGDQMLLLVGISDASQVAVI